MKNHIFIHLTFDLSSTIKTLTHKIKIPTRKIWCMFAWRWRASMLMSCANNILLTQRIFFYTYGTHRRSIKIHFNALLRVILYFWIIIISINSSRWLGNDQMLSENFYHKYGLCIFIKVTVGFICHFWKLCDEFC